MSGRFCALLLLGLALSARAQPPARLEIGYELLRNGSAVADITSRFEHAGGSYQLTETWSGRGAYALLGTAKRTSRGSLGPGGPRPREFADERTGRDTESAWFDWVASTVRMRSKGATKSEPMPADAQDRLSYILALSYLPPERKVGRFHVADGRGISLHEYAVEGRERLKTAIGEFDALKMVREDKRVQIWFAAALVPLPVRMVVLEKGGTRYEQIATRISAR